QPISIDGEHLEAAPLADLHPAHPDGQNIWEGMDDQLVKAVESLPEEYQTVMLLWAIDELSYKEIAASLEVPIGTVMSRLHRARQRLAEQLHEFAKQERIIRD